MFTKDPEGVRVFFGDVLGLPSADAGGRWPIFALPLAEVAAHPTEEEGHHELYLMCDDIRRFSCRLARHERGRPVRILPDPVENSVSLAQLLSPLPDRSCTAGRSPGRDRPHVLIVDEVGYPDWNTATRRHDGGRKLGLADNE